MFKRFIAATEWSGDTGAFISRLGDLRALGAEECLLLESYFLQYPSLMNPSGYTFEQDIVRSIEKNLAELKAQLEAFGFAVKTRLVEGLNKNEIVRIAMQENYGVIVIGSREYSRLGELIFSGLAYEVIHQAQIPVLIFRLHDSREAEKADAAVRGDLNDHILYPTDFSEGSAKAFDHVRQMVSLGAKKVTLMHVQDRYRIEPHLADKIEEFNRIDNERLQQMRAILSDQGKAIIDTVIRYGNPAEEILALIKERGIRLVVMGSQGKGFVKELFLGGVSHSIARQAGASVLLIPMKRA
jgi:nucleotide-binding universal stress UspA family protein